MTDKSFLNVVLLFTRQLVKYLVLFHDCRQQAAYMMVFNILNLLKREILYVVLQESVKIAHWNVFSMNDESSQFLLY